jgi:hypothetical protein
LNISISWLLTGLVCSEKPNQQPSVPYIPFTSRALSASSRARAAASLAAVTSPLDEPSEPPEVSVLLPPEVSVLLPPEVSVLLPPEVSVPLPPDVSVLSTGLEPLLLAGATGSELLVAPPLWVTERPPFSPQATTDQSQGAFLSYQQLISRETSLDSPALNV